MGLKAVGLKGIVAAFLALALAGCASLVTGGPLVRQGEPTGVLRFINASRAPVTTIMISDCSASTYGLNRLPQGVAVPPGRAYDFTVSAGCWDIAAGYMTGTSSWDEARGRLQVAPGRVTEWGVR